MLRGATVMVGVAILMPALAGAGQAASPTSLDTARIEQLTGAKGALDAAEGVEGDTIG